MTKQNKKAMLASIFLSVFIAAEIALLADAAASLFFGGMPVWLYAAVWLAAGCVQLLPAFTLKRKGILAAVILAAAALPYPVGYGCWSFFAHGAAYQDVDAGKDALFAGKSVMLIVPHEDDDINVAGGVLEQYAKYGSQVYVVYVTNGDYWGLGQTRINEAISYCEHAGISEDHVIFLGYGDQWDENGPHLYNAEPGIVLRSHIGNTATYGTAEHPAYHDGNAYTVDHLMEDLQSVILEYRPDILFCSDYDASIDHQAVSLAFEKTMGVILRSEKAYTPAVFKGFAYKTAWLSAADFYTLNILSTKDTDISPYFPDFQEPETYRWEERVRFPVSASLLSRSLRASGFYEGMESYSSQNAADQAARVVNGDKVFWRRQTESLCYGAEVQVSSGQGALLNDFMLVDNVNLLDESRPPFDGTWIPEATDPAPTVTVTFPEKTDLDSIVLYDHPAEDQNILNAVIRFDDGTEVETGPLDPAGAASNIAVGKTGVSSFQVILTQTEGDSAGLTEVEAFRQKPDSGLRFIKVMDGAENFVYDYCIDESGEESLLLYTQGENAEITAENYSVSCGNKKTSAEIRDGKLVVNCPKGEEGVVTVCSISGDCSDSIYIRNPGSVWRWWTSLWQKAERWMGQIEEEGVLCKLYGTVTYRAAKKVWHMLRSIA